MALALLKVPTQELDAAYERIAKLTRDRDRLRAAVLALQRTDDALKRIAKLTRDRDHLRAAVLEQSRELGRYQNRFGPLPA